MSGFENYETTEILSMVSKYMPDSLRHEFLEYNGYIFTEGLKKYQQDIENFEVYDDDIWLTSFPKSGTTWSMEMVWSLCNDLNGKEALKSIELRFPFLEYCTLHQFPEDDDMNFINKSLEYIANKPRPRFIKTHLPWDLLPAQIRTFDKRPKIIHIMRNPKDVAVSFYHHNKLFRGYTGPPNLFYQLFLRDKVRFGPLKKSVESFWIRRNEPNVLILSYENMKSDLKSVIKQTAKFLQVEITEEKMTELLQRLSLKQMKKNNINLLSNYLQDHDLTPDKTGSLVRTGKSGNYKEEMDEESQMLFDKWLKDSKLYNLYA